MQHFVPLNVHTPIARALFQRQIRMLPQNGVTNPLVVVPSRFQYPNFRIADRFHRLQRPIGGTGHIDDDFITQRKQRANRRHKRIAQGQAIADKSKPTNFHNAPTLSQPRKSEAIGCRHSMVNDAFPLVFQDGQPTPNCVPENEPLTRSRINATPELY